MGRLRIGDSNAIAIPSLARNRATHSLCGSIAIAWRPSPNTYSAIFSASLAAEKIAMESFDSTLIQDLRYAAWFAKCFSR